MTLTMELGSRSYDIVVQRGVLNEAASLLNLARKCLIVTGENVLEEYAARIASQCKTPVIARVPTGEGSKSFAQLERLCRIMLEQNFHRTDCVIAVGGGKVGDLAVEIAYALPYYEKKGDGYRLVRRGAVLLSIFQSPIITLGKTL